MIDKYNIARLHLAGALLLALSATAPARADYPSTVLSQSPDGYWRLNETTQPQNIPGAANAGSLGSSGLGTYNNFPTRGLPGPFTGSSAVGLDGGSQYVSTPWQAAYNTTTAFSVELWANPALVPKFAYVASSVDVNSPRSGWYLAQDDGSTFSLGSAYVLRLFNTNTTSPSITLSAPVTTAGAWYHLVITYDGTTASLYTNGVLASSGTPTKNAAGLGYVGNLNAPLTIGCRSSLNFFWPGETAEVALYTTALSAARVSSHYTTATTTPASYASTVGADSPAIYYRFQEPSDPVAANLGTLGAAARGLYIAPAQAGVAGPSSPPFSGFEAANKAANFNGTGGTVQIPALGLNTNTVTYTAWVKVNGAQPIGAGLVVSGSAANACGLTMDQVYGSTGLGYVWNGNAYGVSPTADLGLPALPDNQWAFAAVVIEPAQATLYTCDANNFANFASVVNSFNVNHQVQAFASPTLIGSGSQANFNGAIDEVAIFKRALSAGELYTQYAAAVGGVPVRIFTDLVGPTDPVAVGDPLVLKIDAGGTPNLTYAWRKDGAPIGTTTNGVFTKASTVLGDAGNYDVTISNGSGSAPSQTVTVSTVTPSTPIIVELQGYQSRTLYPTGTLSMAVVATGGGLKYQWFKNASAIPLATGSSYTVARIPDNTVAGSYTVSVTNSMGMATSGPPAVITVLMPTAGSYEASIVASGPEAWWRLDETAGSTNMFDGMGRHNGTYTNATGTGPLPTLGAAGALVNNANSAATFSSTGKGIGIVPYSPELNPAQFTIEAWVNTSVTDGQAPVSSSYGTGGWWLQSVSGWWLGDCSQGTFGNNGQVNTEAAIIPGAWSHVVIEYDSTRVISGTYYPFTFYVNGVTDGYVWGAPAANAAGPFIIGARGVDANTLADRFFDGKVDEVAIYKRLLTPTELQSHITARGVVVIPPSFTTPFLSQTVAAGKTVAFTTALLGTTPISLQWYKGATLITGATTATLTLANVAATDVGTYTLWATNSAGTVSQSATLAVITPTGYANVTNNLVLHLKFDGDLTDSSGRGNNATAVGSPTLIAGTVGSGAFHVNTDTASSIYNYATLGANLPADLAFGTSGNFSIAYWIRLAPNAAPGDLPVLCSAANSYGGNGITIAPSYKLGGWSWSLNSTGIYGPDNSINNGNWHCVITTFDRTGNALTYLDGVLVNTLSIKNAGNVDQPGPMNIGQGSTGTYAESGAMDIDDLGVWGRVLTPQEVAEIESAGSTAGRSFDTVAPPSVTITATKSGSNVILAWPNGTLLQADTPNAPAASWTAVPGASAPSFSVPAGSGSKYYKVQVQ